MKLPFVAYEASSTPYNPLYSGGDTEHYKLYRGSGSWQVSCCPLASKCFRLYLFFSSERWHLRLILNLALMASNDPVIF